MMGRYRKVEVRIWNDSKFRALSDDGQLAFLFILTHPHMTSLGAMRASVEGLAAEKGWQVTRFRKAFQEALSKGMVEVDEKAALIALPNFIKHNQPENPNVVKSWSTSDELLPECDLKAIALQRVKDFLKGFGKDPAVWEKAFDEAFPKASRKGMAKHEHEQEHEQEQEQKKDTPHTPRKRGRRNYSFPPELLAEFETFWSRVPVKIGKGAALEVYAQKRANGVTAERILEGVGKFEEYERGRKARDPNKYTPLHPRTWLSQARWEDELPSSGNNGKPHVKGPVVPPGHPAHGHALGERWKDGPWEYFLNATGLLVRRGVDATEAFDFRRGEQLEVR